MTSLTGCRWSGVTDGCDGCRCMPDHLHHTIPGMVTNPQERRLLCLTTVRIERTTLP
jgi:hypothetical protein